MSLLRQFRSKKLFGKGKIVRKNIISSALLCFVLGYAMVSVSSSKQKDYKLQTQPEEMYAYAPAGAEAPYPAYEARPKPDLIRTARNLFVEPLPWRKQLATKDPFAAICSGLEWTQEVAMLRTYFEPESIVPVTWKEVGISKARADQRRYSITVEVAHAMITVFQPEYRNARDVAPSCFPDSEAELYFSNSSDVMERITDLLDSVPEKAKTMGVTRGDLLEVLRRDLLSRIYGFRLRYQTAEYVPWIEGWQDQWGFSSADLELNPGEIALLGQGKYYVIADTPADTPSK